MEIYEVLPNKMWSSNGNFEFVPKIMLTQIRRSILSFFMGNERKTVYTNCNLFNISHYLIHPNVHSLQVFLGQFLTLYYVNSLLCVKVVFFLKKAMRYLYHRVVSNVYIYLFYKPPSSPETPSSSMAASSSTPSYAPQAASTQAPSADTLSESTINLKRELEVKFLFPCFSLQRISRSVGW